MRVAQGVDELIGRTPLLELNRFREEMGLRARVLAKIECVNPGGSIKDRVARQMLDSAEAEGRIRRKVSTLIEPTSGNTGIGLCALAAARGYRAIIVMPDTMSVERRQVMQAFGAEIVLTPGKEGMTGAIRKAKELEASMPDAWIPSQFENPANPLAHYLTTGPEIEEDTGGQVDVLVAGVGTGGTLSGTGRFLREKHPGLKVIAVEPKGSPVLSEGKSGPHGLQGIGAGFVPDTLDTAIYDSVETVTEEEAYRAARQMAAWEGLLVGISSGAALHAALKLAAQEDYAGKVIVVILPDTGDRYLSTPLFARNGEGADKA